MPRAEMSPASFGRNNLREESYPGETDGALEAVETSQIRPSRGEGIMPVSSQIGSSGGGGGGGGGKASDLLAAVTREMWEDYKKRFFPLEEQLMGMTTYKDPSLMEREVEKGQGRVEATFGSLWVTAVRRASSYGQSWDAAQYQANLNAHRLDKTAALADAANRIREKIIERDREIATGASTAEKTYPGGYMGGTA